MKKFDLLGNRFGRFTVIKDLGYSNNHIRWLCKCDCGEERVKTTSQLRAGAVSCGCKNREIPPSFKDKTGRKYGRLTAVKVDSGTKYMGDSVTWLCMCECGNTTKVSSGNLKEGKGGVKSCGCLLREFNMDKIGKYGKYQKILGKPTNKLWAYKSYKGIIERCYDSKCKAFKSYGGRGIKVCDRWRESFLHFIEDMGDRSKEFSIERIDVNGNYESLNCKWIRKGDQGFNRRDSLKYTIEGETLCLSQWAQKFKLSYSMVYSRVERGWDISKALQTPSRRKI